MTSVIQMVFVFTFPLHNLEFSFGLFALWSHNTCFSFRYLVLTIPSLSKMNEVVREISYNSLFITKTTSILRLPSRIPPWMGIDDRNFCDVETVPSCVLSKTVSSGKHWNCG